LKGRISVAVSTVLLMTTSFWLVARIDQRE
jgi:hypothetical protein